ncbi:MAG: mechanosensitive ion channel family protein [Aestuariivirga sp.]
MNLSKLQDLAYVWLDTLMGWLSSPQFYAQAAAIAVGVLAARLLAGQIMARAAVFRDEPTEGALLKLRRFAWSCRDLLFPLLIFLLLGVAASVSDATVGSSWLVRIGQSLGLVFLLYAAINRFVTHPVINAACRWIGIPVAALYVFGFLDDVTGWLDSVAFEAGNIRLSAYALIKAGLFGGVLFWLGRMSTSAGQKVIRDQQAIDIQTRELAAKFLEIAIFFIVGILLLNILGLDLTALAVFGGALGVGLGFGLQQIASNFISGIIILLERSLKIGDHIEMEDGKAGTLREINMRSSTLSTGDGKEIMIPNEKFVTTQFTNWTKTDRLQRYEVPFHVPYDCDLWKVQKIVAKAVAAHPQVLGAPHEPDCKLTDFALHGVKLQAAYWVDAGSGDVKDYDSDMRFLIWEALKAAKIEMPVVKEVAKP